MFAKNDGVRLRLKLPVSKWIAIEKMCDVDMSQRVLLSCFGETKDLLFILLRKRIDAR